jgi:hypothetical protein
MAGEGSLGWKSPPKKSKPNPPPKIDTQLWQSLAQEQRGRSSDYPPNNSLFGGPALIGLGPCNREGVARA